MEPFVWSCAPSRTHLRVLDLEAHVADGPWRLRSVVLHIAVQPKVGQLMRGVVSSVGSARDAATRASRHGHRRGPSELLSQVE